MARLQDPAVLAKYMEALREWNCDGFIQWKRLPAEWLRRNLDGFDQRSIGRLMCEHVENGGEIDQVEETREDYRHLYRFYYDLRIPFGERIIYVETRFDETRMGPTITVVNMHDA